MSRTGLSYEFILRHDCREPHCSRLTREQRISHIDDITAAHDYAPGQGYSLRADQRGILFGNWNEFSGKAADLLERAGWEIEWEDEWITCSDCARAIRTQPDSYSWQAAYTHIPDSGEILCLDCTDWTAYLESLEDNPDVACLVHCDPAEHGYILLSGRGEYESGLHPGQNSDPRKILADLHARGYRRVLFRISDVGQFDLAFETWQHVDESEQGQEE